MMMYRRGRVESEFEFTLQSGLAQSARAKQRMTVSQVSLCSRESSVMS